MDQFDPLQAAIDMHGGDESEGLILAKQEIAITQVKQVVRELVEREEVLVYSSIYISPLDRKEDAIVPAAIGAYRHHRPGEPWDETLDLFGVLTVDALKEMLGMPVDRPRRGQVPEGDEELIVDLYRVLAICGKYRGRAGVIEDAVLSFIQSLKVRTPDDSD